MKVPDSLSVTLNWKMQTKQQIVNIDETLYKALKAGYTFVNCLNDQYPPHSVYPNICIK